MRPAITSGQFLLAEATHKENGLVTPVAVVLWASVSESIDQRLSSGVTTKLQAADWKSGNNIWIVDAVGDNQVISAMVKGLREKTWNGRSVKLWEQGANGTWSTRILQPAVS